MDVHRRIGLLDLMILVAAAAGATVAARRLFPNHLWWPYDVAGFMRDPVAAAMAPVTLAVAVVRLRKPRPPRADLWGQPGFVACLAALFGLSVGAAHYFVYIHTIVDWEWAELPLLVWRSSSGYAGPAVLGAWLTLLVNGRWKPERSWIDRLGRVVGVFWLIEFFLAEWQFGRWTAILTTLIMREVRS